MHDILRGTGPRPSFVRFVGAALLIGAFVATASGQRLMENLGRGVVAVRASETEVFLSWRLLGYEPQDLAFNVYRSANGGPAQLLNASPLTAGTNFTDTTANPAVANTYFVRAVVDGFELQPSGGYTLPANAPVRPYLSLPLQATPWPTYVHFVRVGDLDGDGEYDYVVDRLPLEFGNPQLLEAYRSDGTFLWRMNFGPNSIDPGEEIEPTPAAIDTGHNDGATVYDLDGDGRAEVVVKSADGVIFADGQVLSHGNELEQFISVLDGMTGAERARAPVPTDYIADGSLAGHFGIAYLDGVRPSFVFKAKNRVGGGPFNVMVTTWDFDGANLVQRWKFAPGIDDGFPNYHQIRIVDVDGDGRDEICDGGYVLDDDGSVLYSLAAQGVVHGDRFHIGDLDPDRPGLEAFSIQQNNPSGLLYFVYDAATGTMIRQHFGAVEDTARGVAADVDPAYRGYEYWSFHGIHEIQGGSVISPEPLRPWPNFRIWWDGDVLSENMEGIRVEKWDPATGGTIRLLTASDDGAINSWRSAAQFYGDILGDWREEIVFEKDDHTALLIYTTPIPTDTRLYTLAHNPEYRLCFTVKGYLQSNMVDYYLGDGMTQPPAPDIVPVVGADATAPFIVDFTDDNGFSADDRITNDTTVTLSGLAPPSAPVTISILGVGDIGSTVADGDGTWSFAYGTPLADGTHTFLARITGGTSYSPPFAIEIETVSPPEPVVAAVVASGGSSFMLLGSAEPFAQVQVTIDGVGALPPAAVDGDGRWVAEYAGDPLAPGVHSLAIVASDRAGNLSSEVQRQVDLSVPVPRITGITEDTGVDPNDGITTDDTLSFSGTAAPGSQVSLYLDGIGVVGTASADGSGDWTFDYSGTTLDEGTYLVSALTEDGLGAELFPVEVDRTQPSVVSIQLIAPEENPANSPTAVFRVAFDDRVSGVDDGDFTAVFGGGLSGAITGVTPSDAATYDVAVEFVAGAGTVRIDLNASGTGIEDLAGNAISGGFTGGDTFTRVLIGDGTWQRAISGGVWSDNANWQDGVVASGLGTTADFSTVDISGDIEVLLDDSHTLTNIVFGDADPVSVGNWIIRNAGSGSNGITLATELDAPTITVDGLGVGAAAVLAVPVTGTIGFDKDGAGTLALADEVEIGGIVSIRDGNLRMDPESFFSPDRVVVSGGDSVFTMAGGTFMTTGRVELSSAGGFVVNAGMADFDWVRGRNNSGIYFHVNGGDVTVNTISFERSTASNLDYDTGFVTRGGTVQVGEISLGTANSNGMMSVEGGTVTVTGAITLGNQSTGGRGGHMRVTGGVLVSSDASADGGLILTRRNNNVATANFLGGRSTIEKVTLGFDGSVTAGSGTLNVDGGELYLGSGGIESNAGGTFAASINLVAGVLGAKAGWSTTLPIVLPEGGNIELRTADASGTAHDITLAGPLTGPGGFTKTGGGVLTLAAANTFEGAIVVNAGTLRIDGSLAEGAAILLNGGTLAGTGAINRSVVLDSATIQPGAQTTSVNGESLTWNGGGRLAFELAADGQSGRLALAGALLKGGSGPYEIAFTTADGFAAGNTYTLATFGSTTFSADDLVATGLPWNRRAVFSIVDGTSLTVTIERLQATVTLSDLVQSYDGEPKLPTVTTDPAGLDVVLAFDGETIAPIFPGTYDVVATVGDDDYAGSASGVFEITITALSRHAPGINGDLDGSAQMILGESFALNGGASIMGDLLVPGTPTVQINGQPIFAGTLDGPGDGEPSGYTVTLNGDSVLRYVVRRVDPIDLPAVDAPPPPSGSVNVVINNPSQEVSDWSAVRNLTLNGNAGFKVVPPGNYGNFLANGNSGFILGVEGATEPAEYGLQGLTLNGASSIQLRGPVILRLAGGVTLNSGVGVGEDEHPQWLTIEIHQGGVNLNGGAVLYATVVAPDGTVMINDGGALVGRVRADRLSINGNGLLAEPQPGNDSP